jgi:hypothetical protein
MPGGTQPIEPSASTGAASTGTSLYTPGCAAIGLDPCVCRSQFAVLFACQMPLKSTFPSAVRRGCPAVPWEGCV